MVLSGLITLALLLVMSTSTARTDAPAATSGIGAGQAAPAASEPAPPPDEVERAPSASHSAVPISKAPTSPVPATSKPSAKAKPVAPTSRPTKPLAPVAQPTLSKTDKEALDLVDFWWDVFVIAMKRTEGTKLTTTQLRKPEVVIVSKANCKQPESNRLGPKSRKSFTYCDGKLDLIPNVFMTITELGQLRVVASGFMYHALATTPDSLRDGRNDMAVLGCLQGGLASALLQHNTVTSDQDVWVVISPDSWGEDLHNGYVGTLEQDGRWS
jgi:hypothetical protein